MSITEKDITICGHGSGNPSTKNMYTYNSQRYSSVASNGKRKGVVCVLRLKALTDSGRTKYHDTYKTILGRNIYNQNLRNYVYKAYNGKYYSDCSSSICATFAKIGYNVSLLNTAGMYYSSLFEKVPVNISGGHITNPEILKVGDCLMYAGSDPSRPLQIGHVESVYEIKSSVSTNSPSTPTSNTSYNTLTISTGKAGLTVTASSLKVRNKPQDGDKVSSYKQGANIYPKQRTSGTFESYWFKTDKGWCSGKYLKGWVLDKKVNKWWFIDNGDYYKSCWEQIGGSWFYFESDGYMASDKYIKYKDHYCYVDSNGYWIPSKDTKSI